MCFQVVWSKLEVRVKRREIAVVTGTRAEFGLLLPVMRAIEKDKRLRLHVVVAGAHLTTGTWKDVRDAGLKISHRVSMQKKGVSGRGGDVAALSKGIAGFGKVFEAIGPDFVVVLGDRIEAFAGASAGSVGGYRVAHIHGGDRAEGVADEAMRHAMTKLAHLHFPATVQSKKRLMRMGEGAERVFMLGSPAVDDLQDIEGIAGGPEVIVLQHPVGGVDADECRWMKMTLEACKGYDVMVLQPNGDAGCGGIVKAIKGSKCKVVDHLPRREWLGYLKGARVLVGNSSAGLIEAAVLRTAVVNIGPRQGGRERAGNVIDVGYDERAIKRAVKEAMGMDLSRMRHPYGKTGVGERIAGCLGEVSLERVSVKKQNVY